MGRGPDSDFKKNIRKQYKAIMDRCNVHMDELEKELPPPREELFEALKSRGVSRRDFLKWTSAMTAALMLPPLFRPLVARAAENFSRIPAVWINFAGCTGCAEAFLRSSYPNIDDILLETIDLEYHETLMAAAGYQAEQCLEKTVKDFKGKFICMLEGALPRGLDGKYITIGAQGKTGIEIAKEVAPKAGAVLGIGSCAAFGNIPAARPNPTNAAGIQEAIGVKTVNISGCPPNAVNITGTLLHYIMFGGMPPLDSLGRPLWAYGKRIHDVCERRSHYDAAEFVSEWGDEAAKKGWCLYNMGCKGPYTYGNCGRDRYNDHLSWPVMAGHGCIGCYEPAFWDRMAPLEKPVHEGTIGGGERTVDTIGAVLTGVAVAGVAAHAILSGIRHRKGDIETTKHKEEPPAPEPEETPQDDRTEE